MKHQKDKDKETILKEARGGKTQTAFKGVTACQLTSQLNKES